jgi:hypothetical protein
MNKDEIIKYLLLPVSFFKVNSKTADVIIDIIKSHCKVSILDHNNFKTFNEWGGTVIINDTHKPQASKFAHKIKLQPSKYVFLTDSTNLSYFACLFHLTGEILPGKRPFMSLIKSQTDATKALEDLIWPKYGINMLRSEIPPKIPIVVTLLEHEITSTDPQLIELSMVDSVCVMLYDILNTRKCVVCARYEDTLKKISANMTKLVEEFGQAVVRYSEPTAPVLITTSNARLVLIAADDKKREMITKDEFDALSFPLGDDLNHLTYIICEFNSKLVSTIKVK